VTARADEKRYHVGGPRLLEYLGPALPPEIAAFETEASNRGQTTIYLLEENAVLAAFALADVVRPQSREAIDRFHEMGIQVAMLTGDAEAVAQAVAGELGIDQYFAQVLPQHKDQKVAELQRKGRKVAMVGDGVMTRPRSRAQTLASPSAAGRMLWSNRPGLFSLTAIR
jgi:P-type Cu2+ transporter